MTISVMIATRDRCHDLRMTCQKVRELRPLPLELLIWSDGCVDGTAAMVRKEFPEFHLIENPRPMGSICGRDHMLRIARGEVVLSLDDDSYPMQTDFLAGLERVMAEHPEAAVIVFHEVRDGIKFSSARQTGTSPGHYVSAYANCAAAMRREFYLKQPGFAAFFRHMYEEPDYALQCYAAGASVWYEPSLAVRHRESAMNRVPLTRHHLNACNEMWSVWLRCPWPWLALLTIYRVVRQFVYACSEGRRWAFSEPSWWISALKGLPECARMRRPVQWKAYRRWMRLARRPIYTKEELRREFGRIGN